MRPLDWIQRQFTRHRARRARRGGVPVTVWHDSAYRLPLDHAGVEVRRADWVLWTSLDLGIIDESQVARPTRVRYADMAAVHSPEILERLGSAEGLAHVFGLTPADVAVDAIATGVRLACGATLEAARTVVARGGSHLNLLGGFHHASPNKVSGFSPINDVAVAVRALRGDGFSGRVVILDLDAHPPDGTADCLQGDEATWIGSISGAAWGALPNVDETYLPDGDDVAYAHALAALLGRMPRPALAFVLAGADVLAGDRFGGLRLTLEGALSRDLAVREALGDAPSVWLSAGGYHDESWKLTTHTLAALALKTPIRVPPSTDPLRLKFSRVAAGLAPPGGAGEAWITENDIAEALGMRPPGGDRLLGLYSAEWLEYALHSYGVLRHVRSLGYANLRVTIDRRPDGDRLRLLGTAAETEHVLVEALLDRVVHGDATYLFVNWLTLRHPSAPFTRARPRLPGQDAPGLGLAREAGELLGLMARRLGLAGVAIRPAAYHVAYTARHEFVFVDADRQARFERLVAQLEGVPLAEATLAVERGEVLLEGVPYRWEPDLMIAAIDPDQRSSSSRWRWTD